MLFDTAEAHGSAKDSTQLQHLLRIKPILQMLEIPLQLLPG
jgi:hypothetical protein